MQSSNVASNEINVKVDETNSDSTPQNVAIDPRWGREVGRAGQEETTITDDGDNPAASLMAAP
ncbi:hypothetical protein PG993_011277 [Apiospora rasikravindrae]|uniref:Uncharacterized protein n=1 Tax=Apiospora rasikravindrae TaxID=990691 RepID=A0ABR1SE27_9PEZI